MIFRFNQRQTSHIDLWRITLGVLISQCTLLIPVHANPELKLPLYTLSQVLKENSTGLQLLPKEQQDQILKDARIYTMIKRGKGKRTENQEFQKNCDSNHESSPFCSLLTSSETKSKNRANSFRFLFERTHRNRIRDIQKIIQEGQAEKLSKISEQQVRESLRSMNSYESLQKLSQALLASEDCKYSGLNVLFATKAEEFLPDLAVRNQSIQLYKKSATCGDTEASARAKFRLSLLHIWEGDCKTALTPLKSLSDQTTLNDYRSRALYWQYQCRMQLKEDILAQETKKTLLEKYPFSLHTLLLQKENFKADFPIPTNIDSPIEYRSKNTPEINPKITSVEALLQINELTLASETMDQLTGDLDKTEPEFRLYTGTLYHRLDQYLKKFKVLNALFRDYPNLVSKPAIELYYSQNAVQSEHFSKIDIDGLLLLSLIRQESAFNTKARSPAGALGLMQVMPTTARRISRIRRASELLNPSINIKVGSKYFSYLMRNYGGDAELALAAYNAGPHRVDQWIKRYPVKDRILFLDLIPFKETREYVASIARNYFWYVRLDTNKLDGRKEPPRNISQVFSLFGT
jgi:soluble lytic murein transglycosylase